MALVWLSGISTCKRNAGGSGTDALKATARVSETLEFKYKKHKRVPAGPSKISIVLPFHPYLCEVEMLNELTFHVVN